MRLTEEMDGLACAPGQDDRLVFDDEVPTRCRA
jgi:hypothetical protein